MPCAGDCTDCNEWKVGRRYGDGIYCDTCWEYYELQDTRCFSFAAIYDSNTGRLLTVGSSHIGTGCAERRAMWRLEEDDILIEKTIVVCRVRRHRNNKRMSFGMSKPCTQCISAMHMYNMTKIAYSDTKDAFTTFIDLNDLCNTYQSASKIVVKM